MHEVDPPGWAHQDELGVATDGKIIRCHLIFSLRFLLGELTGGKSLPGDLDGLAAFHVHDKLLINGLILNLGV